MVNEFGQLAKGVGTRTKTGTETIEFIKKSSVPQGKTVTYARVVAELRKKNQNYNMLELQWVEILLTTQVTSAPQPQKSQQSKCT